MSANISAMDMANHSDHMMFPNSGMRVLSALIQFLGVSILAHCLSRRLASEQFLTIEGLRDLTWPRFCILMVLLDSWLFIFTSGILIFGVGLEKGALVCSLAIYLCIACYGTSKFFIYCFLIEKVHVVWAPTTHTKRFKSPVYIISLITVGLYAIIATLLFLGRIHYLRGDGACVIGLDLFATIPLLVYDCALNLFLTGMFLWPLVRTGSINPMLRRVALRTLIAATVSLTTSSINVLMLTMHHGRELGWICLGSCGADVICNAIALFWVTERSGPHFSDNIKIGASGFPPIPDPDAEHGDIASYDRKTRSSRHNSQASSPPDTPMKHEDFFNQQESSRRSDVRVSFATQRTSRPSLVKLDTLGRVRSRSESKSPWSAKSMDGFLRRSPDRPEDNPLEVQITTEHEVTSDEIMEHRRYSQYSSNSMQEIESSHPSSDIER